MALSTALQRWHRRHPELEAVAVVVSDRDGTWQADSFARRRRVSPTSPRPSPIASLTKTFTLALVMREVREGHDRPGRARPPLPGLDDLNEALGITPRQLLQHASALVNYTEADEFEVRELTPADAVAMSMRTPLRSEPGTAVYYANTNYLYLGMLVEHVTGRPYHDLVIELAQEVGLTDTDVNVVRGKGWIGHSSGGMSSSLPDLSRWLTALFTPDQVIDPRLRSARSAASRSSSCRPACADLPVLDGLVHGPASLHRHRAPGRVRGHQLVPPAAGVSVAVRISPAAPGDGKLSADLGKTLVRALGS